VPAPSAGDPLQAQPVDTATVSGDGEPGKPARDNPDQWAALAGLRFGLAVVVLCYHVGYFAMPDWTTLWNLPAHLSGYAAVIGFFAVSGYSIAASVDREAKHYAERRVWRIYPTFLACFVIAQAPFLIAQSGVVTVDGRSYVGPFDAYTYACWFASLFCLADIIGPGSMTIAQQWSLTCEVIYYCFAPLLKRTATKPLLIAGAVSLAVYIAHTIFTTTLMSEEHVGLWPVAGLAWAWLAGFLAWRYRRDQRLTVYLIVCLVAGVAVNLEESQEAGAVTMLAVALLISNLDRIRLAPKIVKLLTVLGGISYPLYLIHYSAMLDLAIVAHGRHLPQIAYVAAALAAASLIYVAVDLPIAVYRRWKDRSTTPLYQARTT
jgi:peptidoglycan/LPS O-acetylase OafA/YrhL